MVNLDKLDRIVINIDQMEGISKWVQNQKFDSINIPMHEVLILIDGIETMGEISTTGLYFKSDDDGNTFTIKQYDMDDHTVMLTAIIDEDFPTSHKAKIESIYEHLLSGDYINKLVNQSIVMIFDIFQYIVNRDELVISRIEVTTRKFNPKPSKTKRKYGRYTSRKPIRFNVTRYEIKDEEVTEKREYERSTHAWSVRGHWRIYRSTGKKVWIEGYTKGDESKGFNEKIYDIQDYICGTQKETT